MARRAGFRRRRTDRAPGGLLRLQVSPDFLLSLSETGPRSLRLPLRFAFSWSPLVQASGAGEVGAGLPLAAALALGLPLGGRPPAAEAARALRSWVQRLSSRPSQGRRARALRLSAPPLLEGMQEPSRLRAAKRPCALCRGPARCRVCWAGHAWAAGGLRAPPLPPSGR